MLLLLVLAILVWDHGYVLNLAQGDSSATSLGDWAAQSRASFIATLPRRRSLADDLTGMVTAARDLLVPNQLRLSLLEGGRASRAHHSRVAWDRKQGGLVLDAPLWVTSRPPRAFKVRISSLRAHRTLCLPNQQFGRVLVARPVEVCQILVAKLAPLVTSSCLVVVPMGIKEATGDGLGRLHRPLVLIFLRL